MLPLLRSIPTARKRGAVCVRCALKMTRGAAGRNGSRRGTASVVVGGRAGNGNGSGTGKMMEISMVGKEGGQGSAGKKGDLWGYYFFANVEPVFFRGRSGAGGPVEMIAKELKPHRRRQFFKKMEQEQTQQQQNGESTILNPTAIIPPDASSLLSTAAASANSIKRTAFTYLALTKPRLSFLVVLSAAASYALFPTPPLLVAPDTPTLSTLTLVYLTVGTGLCSASANTLNMHMETSYDAQMSRTRNRPLVRKLVSPRAALAFAIVCGATGATALWFGCSPTVSGLGVLNIVLYAGVYTPMKRMWVLNTWVGAVVGGIPPLMGWAAAASHTSTSTFTSISPSTTSSTTPPSASPSPSPTPEAWYSDSIHTLSHPGGWLLFTLLFAWQFPHFSALSHTIAQEYRLAGYQMLAWKYPHLNTRVALRYSLLMFPICFGLTAVSVTDKSFLITSSVVNMWLVKEAWRFWRLEGGKGTARGLFWASVWHLPGVMVLAMVHKVGLWDQVWRAFGFVGEEEEGDEWVD